MKIQAITVAVNYSDYFCWTAMHNQKIFDKWIIVTDKKDLKTKRICDEYNLTCIQTDVFYENGAKFNKYKGINEGLKLVDKDAWVVFLDADIVLHNLTRRALEQIPLFKDCLYGCDRLNCKGFEKWIEYCNKPQLIIDNWLMTSAGFEFGARINQYYGQQGEGGKFRGYMPLGFFQMAHRSSFDRYPDSCLKADHCDLEFVKLWNREDRVLIPEIMGIHLESSDHTKGVNWSGRKSPPFAPKECISCFNVIYKWQKFKKLIKDKFING